MNKKQPSGVTLLELILVILLIGILAAVMIPGVVDVVERRRGEVCINNMRMILSAWKIYNMKREPDYPPASGWYPTGQISDDLDIEINEQNFGNSGTGEPAFNLWHNPGVSIRLYAYKLQPPHEDEYIYCRYFFADNRYSWYGTWFDETGITPPTD